MAKASAVQGLWQTLPLEAEKGGCHSSRLTTARKIAVLRQLTDQSQASRFQADGVWSSAVSLRNQRLHRKSLTGRPSALM